MEPNNKLYIEQPFESNVWKQQLLFMYRQRSVCYRTNPERERGKIILSFSCSFNIFNKLSANLAAVTLFFSRNIVCMGYHRKTWIQAVCALCTHPSSLSFCLTHRHTHNPNASRSNFAFNSCGLTQRGSILPHTSSEKRENQNDTKSRLSIQWGENSFCHCCHSLRDYSRDPWPMLPLHPSCIPSLMVYVCA